MIAVFWIFLSLARAEWPYKPPAVLNAVPRAVDEALGEIARKVSDVNLSELGEPAAQAYLGALGERLLAPLVGEVPVEQIQFQATPELRLNAMASGYKVFVTKGLMAYVANEDELAFTLAHEIAHLVLRHDLQQVLKVAGLISTVLLAKKAFPRVGVSVATWMMAASPFAVILLARRGDRKIENEADLFAVHLLARAGFDPRAAESMLTRFGDLPTRLTFLYSHPSTPERLRRVRAELARLDINQAPPLTKITP